ncbi:hypothetical protein ES703_21044 [subsurface metagenome]
MFSGRIRCGGPGSPLATRFALLQRGLIFKPAGCACEERAAKTGGRINIFRPAPVGPLQRTSKRSGTPLRYTADSSGYLIFAGRHGCRTAQLVRRNCSPPGGLQSFLRSLPGPSQMKGQWAWHWPLRVKIGFLRSALNGLQNIRLVVFCRQPFASRYSAGSCVVCVSILRRARSRRNRKTSRCPVFVR